MKNNTCPRMGASMPCLASSWVFSLLCLLHTSVLCHTSNFLHSNFHNKHKGAFASPVCYTREATPNSSDTTRRVAATRRAATASSMPHKILSNRKHFRPAASVALKNFSLADGEAPSSGATTTSPLKRCARFSPLYPRDSTETVSLSIIRDNRSSDKKSAQHLLNDADIPANFVFNKKTALPLDFAVSSPRVHPSRESYISDSNLKEKVISIDHDSSHYARQPAQATLRHVRRFPRWDKVREKKKECSTSGIKGECRMRNGISSNRRNKRITTSNGCTTRGSHSRSVTGADTSRKRSSEAGNNTKIEPVHDLEIGRFDTAVEKAASRTWSGGRQGSTDLYKDKQSRSNSKGGRRNTSRGSSRRIIPMSTNKNKVSASRRPADGNRVSTTYRSKNNGNTRVIGNSITTRNSRSSSNESSHDSSNAPSSDCNIAPGIKCETKISRGIPPDEIRSSETTENADSSGPRTDSIGKLPQQRRPVAVIRLRLCHFTDFHSAYEFKKNHAMRRIPSCCAPRAVMNTFTADDAVVPGTATCLANADCTSRQEQAGYMQENAAVPDADDGGIWRVPVMQYIFDSLCPVSPSVSAAGSQHPNSSSAQETRAIKSTETPAGTPAMAATGRTPNNAVKTATVPDPTVYSPTNNQVRRDAFAARAFNKPSGQRVAGCPREQAHVERQRQRERLTKAGSTLERKSSQELDKRTRSIRKTTQKKLFNKRKEGRISKASSALFPTCASTAVVESSPAITNAGRGSDSVRKTWSGSDIKTNNSGSHAMQTENNIQSNWSTRCDIADPTSSTVCKKSRKKSVNTRFGNSQSSGRIGKVSRNFFSNSSCYSGCTWRSTSTKSNKTDSSTSSTKGSCYYDTKFGVDADEAAPRAGIWSERVKEEKTSTGPVRTEQVPKHRQEERKAPLFHDGAEGVVQVVPYSLRLFGGDAIPGSDFDALGGDLPGKLLKELKVQVATLGNHEFDHGWRMVDEMLAANGNFTTFIVSNAFTNLNSIQTRPAQQSGAFDRSGYTVPYVLWLANLDGGFVLLKPQQLRDLYSACGVPTARPTEQKTPSAIAGGATWSTLSAGATRGTSSASAATPAAAERGSEIESIASLLKMKQPAAAVCFIGALPKDIQTSTALPADVDFRSEESDHRIAVAMRQCTEAYWKLLRTCSQSPQQLSHDTHLQEMQQPTLPIHSQHHRAAAQQHTQQQQQQLLQHTISSGAHFSLQQQRQQQQQQPQQQLKFNVTPNAQQQQTQQDGTGPQRRHMTLVEVDGNGEARQVGNSVVQSDIQHDYLNPQQPQQKQQTRVQGARRAPTAAPRNSSLTKGSRQGGASKRTLPSHTERQVEATNRFRKQPPQFLTSTFPDFVSNGLKVNAVLLPRPTGVLLSHLGFKEEERIAAESGGAVGGIDFIFSGHSHTELPSHMFPAFVKQVGPAETGASFPHDAVAAHSLTSSFATTSANDTRRDPVSELLPFVPSDAEECLVEHTDDEAEENAEGAEEEEGLQEDEAREDEARAEPDEAHAEDDEKVEAESIVHTQAPGERTVKNRGVHQQETETNGRRNRLCSDAPNRMQSQSSTASKRPNPYKRKHVSRVTQHGSTDEQYASERMRQQRIITKNKTGNRCTRRGGRLDPRGGSTRADSRSLFNGAGSTQHSSTTWQSGTFIITSASHGKLISFVDIYFLVFSAEGGPKKGAEHGEEEDPNSTGVARNKGKKGGGEQGQREDEIERQNTGREGFEPKTGYRTEVEDEAGAGKTFETPYYRERGVWLQSEQLPPVFSTVDVDDFAEWAASAESLTVTPVVADTPELPDRTYRISSQAAVAAQEAGEEAAAPELLGSRTASARAPAGESAAPEETASRVEGTACRTSGASQVEVWGNGSTLHASSLHASTSGDKGHPRTRERTAHPASTNQRNTDSNNSTHSPSSSGSCSSGSSIELHSAAAYQLVCLEETYELSRSHQQKNHQAFRKISHNSLQSFVNTSRRAVVARFSVDAPALKTEQRHAAAPPENEADTNPKGMGEGSVEPTESAGVSLAAEAGGTRRCTEATATEATKAEPAAATVQPYARCSLTAQPIPSLLWNVSSFSFPSYNVGGLCRPGNADRSTVKPAAATTDSRSGNHSPFVACVLQQHSSRTSSGNQGLYRLPYFGWLPPYNRPTAFGTPLSEQPHKIPQQSQQHRQGHCACGQHLQVQDVLHQQSESLPQQPNSQPWLHPRQQQQSCVSPQPHSGRRPTGTLETDTHPVDYRLRHRYQQVPLFKDGSPILGSSSTLKSRKLCFRLSSPLPLFPALLPPAWIPPPLLPSTTSVQPVYSKRSAVSDLVAGGADAGNGVVGGSADADAASATEADQEVRHFFCRAPVNAALVCPFSKAINSLRYKRRKQTRPLGVAAAEGVDGTFDSCRRSECAMGRLISDALRYAALRALLWGPATGVENTPAGVAVPAAMPAASPTARAARTKARSGAPSTLENAAATMKGSPEETATARMTTGETNSAARALDAERWKRRVRRSHMRWTRTEGKKATQDKEPTKSTEMRHEIFLLEMDPLLATTKGVSSLFYQVGKRSEKQRKILRRSACRSSNGSAKHVWRVGTAGPNTIIKERKTNTTDKVNRSVEGSCHRENIAEGWRRSTADAGNGEKASTAVNDRTVHRNGISRSTSKWLTDAEYFYMMYSGKSAHHELKKKVEPQCTKNLNAVRMPVASKRIASHDGFASKPHQHPMKAHQRHKLGKEHHRMQQHQRGKQHQQESKEKGWHRQKQRKRKLPQQQQQRELHEQAVQRTIQSQPLLQRQVKQQEYEEQQSCKSVGMAKHSFVGVIAMQTSGDVRASFCPNCPLTDAEIENVLPWSSPLRIVTLPVEDFLVLSSRSVQKLLGSGSCILETPEASHTFPHLSLCTAVSEQQTRREPEASHGSSPSQRIRCCTGTATAGRITENMCNCPHVFKRSRFYPRSSRCRSSDKRLCPRSSSPCNSGTSDGTSACNHSCCTFKSSICQSSCNRSNHNTRRTGFARRSGHDCGSRWCTRKGGEKEEEPCTVLPLCAENAKEDALESASILQISGARVEIHLLHGRYSEKHSKAVEAARHAAHFHRSSTSNLADAKEANRARETRQKTCCSFTYPDLKKKAVNMDFSPEPRVNESALVASSSSSPSSPLPWRKMSQDTSFYRPLKEMPVHNQLSRSLSLHSAKISVYIPMYPMSLIVNTPQAEKTGFHYIFRENGLHTSETLHNQQAHGNKADDERKKSREEGEEEQPSVIWVKVETEQLLQVRQNGEVRLKDPPQKRKARRADGNEGESAREDEAAERNQELEEEEKVECRRDKKGAQLNQMRQAKRQEKKEVIKDTEQTGTRTEESGQSHDITVMGRKGMIKIEEAEHLTSKMRQAEEPGGKKGTNEKKEKRNDKHAEERDEKGEKERRPTEKRLTNIGPLPVYIQQRSLQQHPFFLQQLEKLLRPNVAGLQGRTKKLVLCRRGGAELHGKTHNTQFPQAPQFREAATGGQMLHTDNMETDELFNLLPLCWVQQQQITAVTQEEGNSTRQLNRRRNKQQCTVGSATIEASLKRISVSAAKDTQRYQKKRTGVSATALLRDTQMFHVPKEVEVPQRVLKEKEIEHEGRVEELDHPGHQRKASATLWQLRQRTSTQQAASAFPFSSKKLRQGEMTGTARKSKIGPMFPAEEPAVVQLKDVVLLGVVDQFFLQGGDQLLLNGDEYSFSVTELPAVEPSQLNAGANHCVLHSERLEGEHMEGEDRVNGAWQQQQQQQHHQPERQHQHQGEQEFRRQRNAFVSGKRKCLAVDASFNAKTARDALAEFIQMRQSQNEPVDSSRFQRLIIHIDS